MGGLDLLSKDNNDKKTSTQKKTLPFWGPWHEAVQSYWFVMQTHYGAVFLTE